MARHSGPSRRSRSAEDSFVQIAPIGVRLLNQVQLPTPLPFFQPRLAINCIADIAKLLRMDQHLHIISFREAWNHSFPVLPNAAHQVTGYAYIERSILRAGENVDVAGFRHSLDVAWMARCGGP